LFRADLARSAYRDWRQNGEKKDYLGFRVARTLAR
jgi:formylglycine-generating enzyme required for sulfatase activity